MINYIKIPTTEELLEGIRNVKVKLPDRDKTLKEEYKIYEVTGASYSDSLIANVNDIVSVKLSGGEGRYQSENTEICLGKNFFDEAIENALVGMKVNESKAVYADGKDITVTLLSSKSKCYSKITLEKVKETLPQVNSLEEFDDYLYNNVADNMIEESVYYKIAEPVINKIKFTAQIEFDDSDIDDDFLEYAKIYQIPKEDHRNAFLTSQAIIKIMEAKGHTYDEKGYEEFIKGFAERKKMDVEKAKQGFKFSMFKYAVSKNQFIDFIVDYGIKNMVVKA